MPQCLPSLLVKLLWSFSHHFISDKKTHSLLAESGIALLLQTNKPGSIHQTGAYQHGQLSASAEISNKVTARQAAGERERERAVTGKTSADVGETAVCRQVPDSPAQVSYNKQLVSNYSLALSHRSWLNWSFFLLSIKYRVQHAGRFRLMLENGKE